MKLNELVTIAPRYTRSVNLERDIGDASAVTGYVLTPIGLDFLRRVHRALTGAPGPRAWSITGPYGSGKSAFVLFLANLLSGTRALGAAESRKYSRMLPLISHPNYWTKGNRTPYPRLDFVPCW